MSANDIVAIFDELGITDQIIIDSGDVWEYYDKEELADYITYWNHMDILKRLLGSMHPLTKQFNHIVNEKVEEGERYDTE